MKRCMWESGDSSKRSIQNQDRGRKATDGGRDVGESLRVVHATAADQADVAPPLQLNVRERAASGPAISIVRALRTWTLPSVVNSP
jgi:hypothetical protein